LRELVEDPTWHEDARWAACEALPWVAPPGWLDTLPSQIARHGASSDPDAQFVASCYARSLARHPGPKPTAAILAALRDDISDDLRLELARALGRGETLTNEAAAALLAMKELDGLGIPVMLSLLLGGSTDAAVEALKDLPPLRQDPATAELADAYYRSFGYVFEKDLTTGKLARWVRNAQAAQAAGIVWPLRQLRDQLESLVFDHGPHSVTRPVARHWLMLAARRGSLASRTEAIDQLVALKERGVLMALARDHADHAPVARSAVRRAMVRP
jgi:hypothetical protein